MKNILPLLVFVLLLIPQGYSQKPMAYEPDFSLTAEDFKAQVLQVKSEIWVLDFWASWCGPCIEAAPYVKEVQRKYADKGVRFISLSWDESPDRWKAALYRLQMPWQHLIATGDLKPFVNQYFKHKGIPAAFIIRRNGKVKRVQGVGMLETSIQRALKS